MPFQELTFFTSPPPNAVLWRYTDFTKYLAMLEKKSLYFRRVDKLGDPFEGFLPQNAPKLIPETTPDARAMNEGFQQHLHKQFYRQRRYSYVSCWHRNDGESAAMWKLYLKSDEGIAIKTSTTAMRQCFDNANDQLIHIKEVEYTKSYDEVDVQGNVFHPLLIKRISFEHEKEVRAFFSNSNAFDKKLQPRNEQPLGIDVPVDLECLLQEIVVSPTCESWFHELVASASAKYGVRCPVRESELAVMPDWKYRE